MSLVVYFYVVSALMPPEQIYRSPPHVREHMFCTYCIIVIPNGQCSEAGSIGINASTPLPVAIVDQKLTPKIDPHH